MSKVILGGGLGGLSAAYYLTKQSPQSLILIESSTRTGGWIKSKPLKSGALFEQGPHTIRPRGDAGLNTLQLVEELNLSDQVVPIVSSQAAARNRIVYVNGSSHLLPSSVLGLFKTRAPFSKPLIVQLMSDLWARRKQVDDESIYDFVERRFGKELADYVISPMICGICAGNAKEISVHFIMSKLFKYEQEYGSISRGLVRNFSLISDLSKPTGLALKAKNDKWSVYSFVGGCETLPLTLHKKIVDNNVNIKLESKCEEVVIDRNHAILTINDKKVIATDHLISSVPASVLGQLLHKQHPDLSNLLESLTKNVTVAVVNLKFEHNLIKEPAFGLLVAPKENLPILGIIYDSCCFPQQNCGTVLTVMMGGYWFEQQFGLKPAEETLLNTAISQVRNILKINEDPTETGVNILDKCIPQYVVGHGQKLSQINDYIRRHQLPLSLCGASYYGVGVNDVILSAKNAVDSIS